MSAKVCSVRHCGKEAVAEVSFKNGPFQLVCDGDLKRFRSASQSSGLPLREAAVGEGLHANSPQEVKDLRERIATLEADVDELRAVVKANIAPPA